MIKAINKVYGHINLPVVVLGIVALVLVFALSGCSTTSTGATTEDATTASEAASDQVVSDTKSADDTKASDTQDLNTAPDDGSCYVVSNVVIKDIRGDKIAEITYSLDERGGTKKVVSRSSADNGKAVWDYTLDENGLPAMVDFEYTGEEGNDAYQTVYEYGDLENGLPASESSIAEFLNDNGEMSEYEYVYDYEYEDGYTAKSSYRIYEDGNELTTQSKSQTYDPKTGVLAKYQSNYMTINFKPKKNSEGQVQTVDFTVAGQTYKVDCSYNDNGTIAALDVTMRGTGEGFSIVPEYTQVENPYPYVRANSKSFIWNGLTAELGL